MKSKSLWGSIRAWHRASRESERRDAMEEAKRRHAEALGEVAAAHEMVTYWTKKEQSIIPRVDHWEFARVRQAMLDAMEERGRLEITLEAAEKNYLDKEAEYFGLLNKKTQLSVVAGKAA